MIWAVVALLAVFVALYMDYKRTAGNIAKGIETNRAIMYLFRRYGERGIPVWFAGVAVVCTAACYLCIQNDMPGAFIIVAIFVCGLQSTYIRA